MYRIAVIQNGIEMQHSGYADGLPLYKKITKIGHEKIDFKRFTGVNVNSLFVKGEHFLLDFDACIIGTNATSDDDVYNVLRSENAKGILSSFIEKGKGVFICSQKKYQGAEDNADNDCYKISIQTKNQNVVNSLNENCKGELTATIAKIAPEKMKVLRTSGFLPSHYEYFIAERDSPEDSKDPGAYVVENDQLTLNQKCLLNLPNKITNEVIDIHCNNNSFQKHYYRDYIIPKYDSAYQSLIVDNKKTEIRDLVMIAVPQNKEKIVISTMSLDWAQHIELIENIINYLVRGIPFVAFVQKKDEENKAIRVLTQEATLNKIGFTEYFSLDDLMNGISWHALIIFSPSYEQDEVSKKWLEIKNVNKFAKVFHYHNVNGELCLSQYSNNTFLDKQVMDVRAWVYSKRGTILWDNSFWKTYDVIRFLVNSNENSDSAVKQVAYSILNEDDKGRKHYQPDGSYDGVIAASCGVIEIFKLAGLDGKYSLTKSFLTKMYNQPSELHNKILILNALLKCKDSDFDLLISNFDCDDVIVNITDMVEHNICLFANIVCKKIEKEKNDDDVRVLKVCLNELIERQQKNGKWENVGNTANVLSFLLEEYPLIKNIFENTDANFFKRLKSRIERGISCIKLEYSVDSFNWENNVSTTANAMNAIILYGKVFAYKVNDLLTIFSNQDYYSSNYNALNISLVTLEKSFERTVELSNQNKKNKKTISLLENDTLALNKKLFIVSNFAVYGIFVLIAIVIWLAIKDMEVFKKVFSELFMWIPVALGLFITPIVTGIIKKLSSHKKDE